MNSSLIMPWSKRALTKNYMFNQGARGTCVAFSSGTMIFILWHEQDITIGDDTCNVIINNLVDATDASGTTIEMLAYSKPMMTVRVASDYYWLCWQIIERNADYAAKHPAIYYCNLNDRAICSVQKDEHSVILDEYNGNDLFGIHNSWGLQNEFKNAVIQEQYILDLYEIRIEAKKLTPYSSTLPIANTFNHQVLVPLLENLEKYWLFEILSILAEHSQEFGTYCNELDTFKYIVPLEFVNLYKTVSKPLFMLILTIAEMIKLIALLMEIQKLKKFVLLKSKKPTELNSCWALLWKNLNFHPTDATNLGKLLIDILVKAQILEFTNEATSETKLSSDINGPVVAKLYKYLPKFGNTTKKNNVGLDGWLMKIMKMTKKEKKERENSDNKKKKISMCSNVQNNKFGKQNLENKVTINIGVAFIWYIITFILGGVSIAHFMSGGSCVWILLIIIFLFYGIKKTFYI